MMPQTQSLLCSPLWLAALSAARLSIYLSLALDLLKDGKPYSAQADMHHGCQSKGWELSQFSRKFADFTVHIIHVWFFDKAPKFGRYFTS